MREYSRSNLRKTSARKTSAESAKTTPGAMDCPAFPVVELPRT